MLDVNRITATLERLDDASLQRYAAMHKQDPYVLSLAVEESNRRKRMRAAPQQAAQPQPQVNEQAVQAMAPEDTGIAQLPAGDMDFADGGIIAFAEGGRAPGRGEITGALTPWPLIEQRILAGDPDAIEYTRNYLQQPYRYGQGSAPDSVLELMQEVNAAASPPGDTIRASRAPVPAASPAAAPAAPPAAPPPPPTAPPRGLGGLSQSLSMSARTSGGASTGGPSTPIELSDPNALFTENLKKISTGEPARITEAREQARTEALTTQEALAARFKANRPQGEAMEGLQKRLEKEEAGVEGKKDENLKMALINAGLGMMAGTSQYAMANIGAGGAQGLKQYREGIKDLEKAAERRQDLFAKVEQARRAEKEGRAKDELVLDQEAAKINTKYRDDLVNSLEKLYGIDHKTASELAAAQIQQETLLRTTQIREEGMNRRSAAEQAGANARATYTADAAGSREQIAAMRTQQANYAAQLREVQKEISSLGIAGGKIDPGRLAALNADKRDIITNMNTLAQHLNTVLKIPGDVAPGAGAGAGTPTRQKFDAQGNPIR